MSNKVSLVLRAYKDSLVNTFRVSPKAFDADNFTVYGVTLRGKEVKSLKAQVKKLVHK